MIQLQQSKRATNLILIVGFLAMAVSLYAQAPALQSDTNQIMGLMRGISDHTKTPANVLDPNLSSAERGRNLHRLSAPSYDLSIVPEGPPVIVGDSASIPVKVHFNDHEGNTLDAASTAYFVKYGGTWYFANFDFLEWPWFLIVMLVVGILTGIFYATIVLLLWRKLKRRGQVGVNGVKMFFPIFWPSLFRLFQ
jgi:hypothetical protein